VSRQDEDISALIGNLRIKIVQLNSKMSALSKSQRILPAKIRQHHVKGMTVRRGRRCPSPFVGALLRSADLFEPAMRNFLSAADTNRRRADHVGLEIDKHAYVNIQILESLSGVFFYFVLLIPCLATVSFFRRLFNVTIKTMLSHFVTLSNDFFVFASLACICTTIALHQDDILYFEITHKKSIVVSNLSLALYYAWHFSMLILPALYARERRNCAQVAATACVGFHYLIFTWNRLFTETLPQMLLSNYWICINICLHLRERYSRVSARVTISSKFGHRSNRRETSWLELSQLGGVPALFASIICTNRTETCQSQMTNQQSAR
jgi:hypothetical protein